MTPDTIDCAQAPPDDGIYLMYMLSNSESPRYYILAESGHITTQTISDESDNKPEGQQWQWHIQPHDSQPDTYQIQNQNTLQFIQNGQSLLADAPHPWEFAASGSDAYCCGFEITSYLDSQNLTDILKLEDGSNGDPGPTQRGCGIFNCTIFLSQVPSETQGDIVIGSQTLVTCLTENLDSDLTH